MFSRRSVIRGLEIADPRGHCRDEFLGELKDFVSNEIIIDAKCPLWQERSFYYVSYSAANTDFDATHVQSPQDFVYRNILKKNYSALRSGIEWIKIKSSETCHIINILDEEPRTYKLMVKSLEENISEAAPGEALFPSNVELCSFYT